MNKFLSLFYLILIVGPLTGCGSSDLDDEGKFSIRFLGNGSAQVNSEDLQCTEDCEHLITFSTLETNSLVSNTRHFTAEASAAEDSQFLGWLASNRDLVSFDYPCDDDPVCEVVMQETCAVSLPIPVVCVANSINDLELRPVTVLKDSLIDWDRASDALCVLQQPGIAQCWQTTVELYRHFERTAAPVLNQPTAISGAGNMACALDQSGVHCWSDKPERMLAEPSAHFGLQQVEAIAVRFGYYGCALALGDVTCWQGQAAAQVPELVDPRNLRRDGHAICVDEGAGEAGTDGETLCWSTIGGQYNEWRTP
ncbi:hypothetical protein [Ketobacter sp.]|uniref:hypothetical protein n=1 Tax=Ketobacter sp. TaxID=2083498 RepID=UPI000F0FFA15|nr:hypothetical protein [Ketobacter sp.]RLT99230.1 MAG: hypothetical protein D9N14_08785 [Ketobacter sp.]